MEQVFQELFKFTDYVLKHAGQIVVSIIVLFILWALVKSLLESVVGGLADIFGLKGRREKRRQRRVAEAETTKVAGATLRIGRPKSGKGLVLEVEEHAPAKPVRNRRRSRLEATPEQPQPQPIMVAHPLDIKDEASRRLFEEEVEREKEQMRLRAKQE